MVAIRCFDRVFASIEAVVFDKDGTLAHSETLLNELGWQRVHLLETQVPGVQQRLLDCFGINGQQVDPASLLAVGTRQENEIAAAACIAATGQGWIQSLTIARSAFQQAAQSLSPKATYTPLCDGVLSLIRSLANSGTKLGILSSDTTELVEEFVQTYCLGQYFSVRVGASQNLVKPDPALLLHVCDLLQVAPPRTLVIGDSRADTDMARAAGAAGCIGVSWGWTKPIQLPNADLIVSHPQEIQVD